MANFEITWEAPEYEYREKGVSWYWISIIAAAAVIAFAVWQRNFLFGFFVVVAEILFIVWGNRPPRILRFTANAQGIAVAGEGGKFHPFKEFQNMSVDAVGDGWAEIAFLFHAKLKTPFKCLIPEPQLAELRANLKTILREVPYEQTFLDSIEKLLRF